MKISRVQFKILSATLCIAMVSVTFSSQNVLANAEQCSIALNTKAPHQVDDSADVKVTIGYDSTINKKPHRGEFEILTKAKAVRAVQAEVDRIVIDDIRPSLNAIINGDDTSGMQSRSLAKLVFKIGMNQALEDLDTSKDISTDVVKEIDKLTSDKGFLSKLFNTTKDLIINVAPGMGEQLSNIPVLGTGITDIKNKIVNLDPTLKIKLEAAQLNALKNESIENVKELIRVADASLESSQIKIEEIEGSDSKLLKSHFLILKLVPLREPLQNAINNGNLTDEVKANITVAVNSLNKIIEVANREVNHQINTYQQLKTMELTINQQVSELQLGLLSHLQTIHSQIDTAEVGSVAQSLSSKNVELWNDIDKLNNKKTKQIESIKLNITKADAEKLRLQNKVGASENQLQGLLGTIDALTTKNLLALDSTVKLISAEVRGIEVMDYLMLPGNEEDEIKQLQKIGTEMDAIQRDLGLLLDAPVSKDVSGPKEVSVPKKGS